MKQTMSPLLLVGILVISSSTADVKHVLEGSAPNSISPQAVNHLASQNGDFWWMNPDSPLKAAYDYYKKCNTKGQCITPVNPTAPPPQPFRPQDAAPKIDINKNPFLNGNFKPSGGNVNYNKEESKIDISKNPFLSGSVVTTGDGKAVVKDQDGFLGVQPSQPFGGNKKPGFATSHPLEQKKKPGFGTSHPLEGDKKGLLDIKVECRGQGFMCVEKSLCLNGVVNTNGEGLLQVRSDVRYCHEDTEVCCQLNNLNGVSAGKSSVPGSTIKFAGGDGFSPGLIHVQPLNVQPEIVFGGEHGHHGSGTTKSARDTNSVYGSTVDYSNTKFDDDIRFASTFQGPAYLPPVGPGPTTPQPRPFETRPSINQQYVPSRPSTPQFTTPRPTQPTYRPAPSTAPPVTYRPAPSTTYRPAPSTSREYLPPRSSTPIPTTQYVPQQPYQPSVTPQKPYQPSFPTQRPYQPSITPQQPSVTPQKPYQPSFTPQQPTQRPSFPSVTPQKPYQPSVTPQKPYQPSITPYQPSIPTQRPYQPSVTTPRPYQPSITPQQPYQPSVTPQKPFQPSITPQKPYQPSPTTPRPYQPQQPYQPSITPQRPYQPSPTTPRPYQPSITPYQPSVTPQRPFQPSITPQKPYQPSPTTPRPYQPSYQPSTSRPTSSREYLPPRPSSPFVPQPSSPRPTPFVPQQTTPRPVYPSPSQPIQPRPTPPPYKPSYPSPQPTQPRPTPPPYKPSYPSPQPTQPRPTPPPYKPSYPSPQPTQPRPTPPPFRPTPEIPQFPSPRPSFPSFPSPSYPSSPQPRPSFPSFPSPSSPQPRPSFPTSPQPRPSFPSFPSPSSPQPRPSTFQPRPTTPSVTNGYQYPTPSSPRPNPFIPEQPTFVQPSPTPPRPRPQPTPAPNPSGGYEYPKPTPTFGYPTTPRQDFSNSNINNQYIRPLPPKKPVPDNPDQTGDAANEDGTFVRLTSPRPSYQGEQNTVPPAGCAAALKCVQEIYCTAEGVISPVPVVLSKEQELSRVPTTVCQDTEAGIIGKCCRDPNYKDPWPSANLVNGVDDGQYKEDDSIAQYQPDLQRAVRSHKGGPRQDGSSGQNAPVQQVPQPTCGERRKDTTPEGPGPLDANFAEIPWQAMILRDSNRSLLCGGVIIRKNAVLTAAHCIDGIDTNDILIKGGEWKLGIDEEPLPFQVISVASAIKHPQYEKGSFVNDLALLVLEEKLRFTKNVGPLCLPQPNQIPAQNCVATGWGKRILQLHAKGAIMHAIDVKIMDNQQCQETLSNRFQHAVENYSPNTLCGYSERDQCRVDYGSALACTDGNGYTLSGIYSWDTGCKQQGQIGGYIAPDVEWIESTLAKPLEELRQIGQKN